jgi:mannose-6-phosphate isomerase-like protein (cupin superfamily)
MRRVLIAALLCAPLPVLAQPADKLYASGADVQTLIAKAKADHKSDATNTVEPLALVTGYPVQLEYRTGGTPASIHPVQDEFIEVIEGACTLVTGGTLENKGTPTATIAGGTSRRIAKGDYVLVPANTPHQYTEVQGLVMITLHMPVAAKP